ncbi:YwqG family protein [Glutamicibacter sp. MNS18]|uniref:YwqG family protein n=1 Tax=Glutamicibacter sp. MNS18 TaxID=2989817 RepID=UPI002235F150|nr:YwqG family protein [Glutamicibacter sp. MNS18]MCW4467213.1 YwqG family protein [Glutamicibacter sp. MNS18]
MDAWLNSTEINAGFLGKDLKFTVLLLDQYDAGVDRILAERAELGELSWLGGPALGPVEQWPRTASGEPLAHIATINLGEAQALLESSDITEPNWPEPSARLPESGYLEVFHHLGTYGNPEDVGTGGWLVRYLPLAGEEFPPLVSAPDDLDLPTDVCQPVLLGTGFSVPRAVDFTDSDDATFEAAERVEEELNAAWTAWRRAVSSVEPPVFPISHMYGHSDAGTGYAQAVLDKVRPLAGPGDSYILVLGLESWTFFEGWFGDAGSFEVWMRSSDLDARNFDQAWCMIRTDH